MEDLQAIRRLKRGDMGGLECLIARFQEKALRVAFLITRSQIGICSHLITSRMVQDLGIGFPIHSTILSEPSSERKRVRAAFSNHFTVPGGASNASDISFSLISR